MITLVKKQIIKYPVSIGKERIRVDSLNVGKQKIKGLNVINYVPVSWNPVFNKFIFLWTGIVSGDRLINNFANNWITITGKDFATNYIPVTSTATFTTPNAVSFQTADEDYLWFDLIGNLNNVTVADMIAHDYTRTFIDFNNSAPYDIYKIGILRSGEVLTNAEIEYLCDFFRLWIFWPEYNL